MMAATKQFNTMQTTNTRQSFTKAELMHTQSQCNTQRRRRAMIQAHAHAFIQSTV